MGNYFLLKYDTQHVRVFRYKNDFIEFLYFQDELLSLSDLLFSVSSSLIVSNFQLKQILEYLSFKNNITNLFLYYMDSGDLLIQYNSLKQEIIYCLSKTRVEYWGNLFRKETQNFSTSQNFSLPYFGRENLEKFLNEIGIIIPNRILILKVFYYGTFFFIPFELLYDRFLVEHVVPGNMCTENKLIRNVGILIDPELEASKREFLNVRTLIEKRGFIFNNTNPDLLLVSGHGVRGQVSKLKNEALEEKVKELNPEIVVFNSCAIGQEMDGLIAFCVSRGMKVIASPFDILTNKTIFGPILRFIKFSNKEHVWQVFLMLRIFYPKIYNYFRYYSGEDFRRNYNFPKV